MPPLPGKRRALPGPSRPLARSQPPVPAFSRTGEGELFPAAPPRPGPAGAEQKHRDRRPRHPPPPGALPEPRSEPARRPRPAPHLRLR